MVQLEVKKSDGSVEPFSRDKVERGVLAAGKGRPGVLLEAEIIGLYVLDRLRALDEVAYLRFVSVYKSFEDQGDFERELVLLAKVADNPVQSVDGRAS